jgi:hypothetical protein
MDDTSAQEHSGRSGRGRRIGAKVLLVLGCLLLLLANVTVWLRLTALDTDRFVSALAPLASDSEVQEGLATSLTERIVDDVDIEGRVTAALPNDNPLIISTVTRLARNLIQDAIGNALASDAFKTVWTTALERTHKRALDVIEGADGSVALKLTGVIDKADAALQARGLDVIDQDTIDKVDSIVVARSDQVKGVREAADLLRKLAIALPIAAAVVLGLMVLLSPDRRRALAVVGVGVVVTMVVTAVALRIARRVVLDQIDGDVKRRAAGDVWSGLLSSLFWQTAALTALGVLVAGGAWLAGPSPRAATVRGWFRREPRPATAAPSPLVAAIGDHLRQIQAGVLALGALLLLALPTLSLMTVVVVLAVVIAAVVALQIVGGGSDPKLRQERTA